MRPRVQIDTANHARADPVRSVLTAAVQTNETPVGDTCPSRVRCSTIDAKIIAGNAPEQSSTGGGNAGGGGRGQW